MSRQWTRAEQAKLCGLCGELIALGEPAVIICVNGITRKRWRCQACAGEPPPDLPPLLPRDEIICDPQTPNPTRPPWSVHDWKRKQAGERDPGEDG